MMSSLGSTYASALLVSLVVGFGSATPFLMTFQPMALAQAELTESEIREFIKQIETYTNERNVEKLVEVVAEDVDIAITSLAGEEPVELNAENLKQLFEQGFEGLQDYSVTTEVKSVEIENSTATVTGTTTEVASYSEQQEITTNIEWTFEIEKQNDDFIITKWEDSVARVSVERK